jgi:hypothetical protein
LSSSVGRCADQQKTRNDKQYCLNSHSSLQNARLLDHGRNCTCARCTMIVVLTANGLCFYNGAACCSEIALRVPGRLPAIYESVGGVNRKKTVILPLEA